ncbi:MAG: NAD(P)H-quinone oxidoreductase, partial [Bacteroidota bacterium]
LTPAERPVPEPRPGELLIRVHAAGVNRPDIAQRKGKYPAPPGAVQDVPGLEVAGVVERTGDGCSRFGPGDQVCALLTGGGYAEYAVAHEGHCLPVPKGWSMTDAAGLPEVIFTVWHNVFRLARLKKGETLLIHGGTSGIGTCVIQLAAAFGATVIATTGDTDETAGEKAALCRSLGASVVIDYNKEDFAAVLNAQFPGGAADVILDMIGGPYLTKNLSVLRPDGRLAIINFMGGATAEVNLAPVLTKRLTITGSTLRNRDFLFKDQLRAEIQAQVWPLIEEGRYRPVTCKVFPLLQAAEAHRYLEAGAHLGKVILQVR